MTNRELSVVAQRISSIVYSIASSAIDEHPAVQAKGEASAYVMGELLRLLEKQAKCKHFPDASKTTCLNCGIAWTDALDEMEVAILPGDPRSK